MKNTLLNELCLNKDRPVDNYGKPTTYLTFLILKHMFSQTNRWFTSEKLANLFAARNYDTDLICSQLKLFDFLTEEPSTPKRYKYNLNCENSDLQAKCEKFILDVKLEALPIHLMLDYAPSFRSHP